MLGHGHHPHGRQADQQADAEDPVGALLAVGEVTDRIEGADGEEQADAEEHHLSQRVEPDPSSGRWWRRMSQQEGRQDQMDRGDHRQDEGPQPVVRNDPGE